MINSAARGRQGEDAAVHFLETGGYEVLARNFRCRGGEIDIIARENDTVVFVEVKCWDAFPFSETEYALTEKKVQRIMKAAQFYLNANSGLRECLLRFDLVFISGNLTRINHIINAFSEV